VYAAIAIGGVILAGLLGVAAYALTAGAGNVEVTQAPATPLRSSPTASTPPARIEPVSAQPAETAPAETPRVETPRVEAPASAAPADRNPGESDTFDPVPVENPARSGLETGASAATVNGGIEPEFNPEPPRSPGRSTADPEPAPRKEPGEPDTPQEPVEDRVQSGKPVVTGRIIQEQQEAGVLYQALDIHRQPTMSVLGSVVAQNIHYQILSELKVGEPNQEGLREVSQQVKNTRLVTADATSRGTFEKSLRDLIGWQFSYTLDSHGEVVAIRSPRTGAQIAAVNPAGGQGFLVSSVMDEDGWKELAGLSFFNPSDQDMKKQTWMRQMTHNFEPLGSWQGETTYNVARQQQDVLQINYKHNLTYKPPAAGGGVGGLPFKIANANFKAEFAGGAIYFNRASRRVQSVEERFHVRGAIGANMLGQNISVPIEEKQTIKIGISTTNPWGKQGAMRKQR